MPRRKIPDRDQPNWGYPYSSKRLVHTFVHSSVGHSKLPGSGIVASRWRRHRQNPFGQDFDYTDAHDLTGHLDRRLSWWRRLKSRLSRKPVAWIAIDTDHCPIPQAQMMTSANGGEVRISPIQSRMLVPVYKDYETKALITMDGYEETQMGKA